MRFNLLITAAAATAVMCPALVLAQPAPAPTAAAPAAAPPAAAPTPPAAPLPPSPNLVANGDWITTLKGSPHFTILVKAMDANGLSAQLKAYPNLTIFAPTDDAFRAMPPAQLQALFSPQGIPNLRKVLMYMIINAPVDSSKIKGAKGDVATIDGTSVTLDGGGDVLLVNNADIIQADVKAANNVTIHAVDKVLIPTDVTLPAAAASAAPPAAHTGG